MQSSTFNPIRDTVVLGNQGVYDFTKNAFVFAANMGTSAGLGKLDQAYNVSGSFPKIDVTAQNPASMINNVDAPPARSDIDIPKTVTIVGEQAPDYIKLSDDLGKKIEIDGYKIIDVEDAAQANKDWAIIGYDKPPVADGTKVYNVEAGDFLYSRVFCINSKSKPKSPFILRTDDIEGLNATQIAEKYALPKVPDKIVNVDMPPETPLEVSIVGPQPDWGTLGGDVQYAIKDAIPKSAWFTEISDLN